MVVAACTTTKAERLTSRRSVSRSCWRRSCGFQRCRVPPGPAPALATLDFYQDLGEIPDAGPLSTDVPGAVGGFDVALREYGTMDYATVVAPLAGLPAADGNANLYRLHAGRAFASFVAGFDDKPR